MPQKGLWVTKVDATNAGSCVLPLAEPWEQGQYIFVLPLTCNPTSFGSLVSKPAVD